MKYEILGASGRGRQEPFTGELADTAGIVWRGAQLDDGGQDALIKMDSQILALTNASYITGLDA